MVTRPTSPSTHRSRSCSSARTVVAIARAASPTDRIRRPSGGAFVVFKGRTGSTVTVASYAAGSALEPGLVLPGPGVNPDRVALADEQRHLDDEARLGRGRLAGALGCVAGEARLRRLDPEVDGDRELDPDRLGLVARPVERHAVLH